MDTDRVIQKLTKAWQLRMDQKNGECRAIVLELCEALGLSVHLTPIARQVCLDPASFARQADVLCLVASLHRAEARLAESEVLLHSLQEAMKLIGQSPRFHLYFQKGTNALCRGDFSQSLDLFVHATNLAESPLDRIYALSNTLFCLENLGQPFELVLEDLRSQLAALPPDAVPGVRHQFDALESRQAFRAGRFELLFSERNQPGVNQDFHLRLWCSELPYHTFHQAFTPADRERYFTENPHLYRKLYRMRTIQGVVHPDDLDDFKGSDLCDRLYLWTWRWLTQPETTPMERLLILLESVQLSELRPQLTNEDCYLLRNSLLWIALFHPAERSTLERLADSLKPATPYAGSLLEFEERLVGYFLAERAADPEAKTRLRSLKASASWKLPSVRLRDLVSEKPVFDPLVGLKHRLTATAVKKASFRKGTLYVDPQRGTLTWDGGRKREISEPLCVALELLRRKECVSFAELTEVCFGLPRFDSFVHNAKVYNLLARLKKMLPDGIHLKTKNGRVFVDGNWGAVEFLMESSPFGKFTRKQEWKTALERNRPSSAPPKYYVETRPGLVLAEKQGDALLTRADLERVIGKSRATANRILHSWIVRGLVKRIGKAKNTRYLVLAPLEV